MYACAYARLVDEFTKPTGFLSGDNFFAFIRSFYWFKALPHISTQNFSLSQNSDCARMGAGLYC